MPNTILELRLRTPQLSFEVKTAGLGFRKRRQVRKGLKEAGVEAVVPQELEGGKRGPPGALLDEFPLGDVLGEHISKYPPVQLTIEPTRRRKGSKPAFHVG